MRARLKALIALVAVLSAVAILPAMGVEGGDDESPSLADRVAQLTQTVLGLEAEVEELTAALEAAEDASAEDDVDSDGDGDGDGDEGEEGDEGDEGEEGDDGDDAVGADTVTEESDDETSHGAIVSTVAQCAPSGKVARDAGLPNHGFFVSATARGERDFTFEDVTYDLATQDGADALCAALEVAVTEAESAITDEGDEVDEEGPEESEEPGSRQGRSGEAPGRSGDAPGRSGQAPGQMKKNG